MEFYDYLSVCLPFNKDSSSWNRLFVTFYVEYNIYNLLWLYSRNIIFIKTSFIDAVVECAREELPQSKLYDYITL